MAPHAQRPHGRPEVAIPLPCSARRDVRYSGPVTADECRISDRAIVFNRHQKSPIRWLPLDLPEILPEAVAIELVASVRPHISAQAATARAVEHARAFVGHLTQPGRIRFEDLFGSHSRVGIPVSPNCTIDQIRFRVSISAAGTFANRACPYDHIRVDRYGNCLGVRGGSRPFDSCGSIAPHRDFFDQDSELIEKHPPALFREWPERCRVGRHYR